MKNKISKQLIFTGAVLYLLLGIVAVHAALTDPAGNNKAIASVFLGIMLVCQVGMVLITGYDVLSLRQNRQVSTVPDIDWPL